MLEECWTPREREYPELLPKDELWWCNTHQRPAYWEWNGHKTCMVNQGGITMPCRIVNLTGEVELVGDENE